MALKLSTIRLVNRVPYHSFNQAANFINELHLFTSFYCHQHWFNSVVPRLSGWCPLVSQSISVCSSLLFLCTYAHLSMFLPALSLHIRTPHYVPPRFFFAHTHTSVCSVSSSCFSLPHLLLDFLSAVCGWGGGYCPLWESLTMQLYFMTDIYLGIFYHPVTFSMPPKQKVLLDKVAWQWADTVDYTEVTADHIKTAYRLNLTACERGSCKYVMCRVRGFSLRVSTEPVLVVTWPTMIDVDELRDICGGFLHPSWSCDELFYLFKKTC